MNPPKSSSNPTSIKSKFTKGFLRAFFKINSRNRPGVSSRPLCFSNPKENFQKFCRVRTAADKSLAFSVGPRRAWSRAMIYRIRNQARRARRRHGLAKKLSVKRADAAVERSDLDSDQEHDLRKLVPGGEAMDLCSLLDEAAHYIKCLNTQVQVMRCIADFFTA